MIEQNERFVAYAVQKYPALRTTFIRREVEALRKLGMLIEVFSMRPANRAELAGDAEAEGHLAKTHFLPANPLSLSSLWANVVWAVRRPGITMRNLRLSLDDSGEKGWKHRVRLMLQVWRGAVMASEIRRLGKCTHIHAHFADGAATTGLTASRLLKIPFSFTSHTSHVSAALGTKLREATFIASISEYDRQRMLSRCGETNASTTPIHIVHCGIPVDQWPFQPRPVMHNPIRLLSVGALVATKGHDVLIRACRLLTDRGCKLKCQIIGAGALESELRNLVRELELGAVVELAGAKSQNHVRNEMLDADIFVLACKRAPSGDTEGVPVVLMEAMALGVPVVSSRISGIPELVRDAETGLLAGEGNADSLAAAIERMVRQDLDLPHLLQRARNHIVQSYSCIGEAGRLAQLFGESCQRLTANDVGVESALSRAI